MNPLKKTYKKNLSSEKVGQQIWGALTKHWWLTLLFAFFLALTIVSFLPTPCRCSDCGCEYWFKLLKMEPGNKILYLLFLTSLVATIIIVCNNLTEINSLLRKENRITWSQIWILVAIGLWLIGFIFILGIQKEQKSYIGFGLIGSILAWIFQDKIKGAVAFIHLRMHHLLNIGDWIQIPSKGADGEIKRVTLTTVTLSNWDTTTSTIPINTLQSEHFINLQNMAVGKTYGRKMLKTFTLDTGWIHPIYKEDFEAIKSGVHGIKEYLPEEALQPDALNAHLYRLYLYHWLMNQPQISQHPCLIVRWMDQKDSGMTLQVYAFITDCNLTAFEWQQSRIIEHIISSLEWFGLRLYQSPSAYDAGNSNIFITDKPATYRKEDK